MTATAVQSDDASRLRADAARLQRVRDAYGSYSWREGDVMQAVVKMRKIGKILEGSRGP